MPSIPRELAKHELKIFPNTEPVKQPMRCYSRPKTKSMGEDINRLLEAKFIKELKEATWLSPPVMVKKKDTKVYRMCIDFKALNKLYPKDYFPLPRIDQIINSTTGCERLSFLDAYSGYHQIRLEVEDEENTTFITPHSV
jgi:putative transposase